MHVVLGKEANPARSNVAHFAAGYLTRRFNCSDETPPNNLGVRRSKRQLPSGGGRRSQLPSQHTRSERITPEANVYPTRNSNNFGTNGAGDGDVTDRGDGSHRHRRTARITGQAVSGKNSGTSQGASTPEGDEHVVINGGDLPDESWFREPPTSGLRANNIMGMAAHCNKEACIKWVQELNKPEWGLCRPMSRGFRRGRRSGEKGRKGQSAW